MQNSVIDKIINSEPNTYIIFFVYECPYSMMALDLLRKSGSKYKGYNINAVKGGMAKLLETFNNNSENINFNKNHKTKPIIFFNKKFIGGYDELSKILKN